MAKKPVTFVSLQFEPKGEALLFDDPTSVVRSARLNLLLWRKGADGRTEVSEAHCLGEANNTQEFEALLRVFRKDLDETEDQARSWFGFRRPFWRR